MSPTRTRLLAAATGAVLLFGVVAAPSVEAANATATLTGAGSPALLATTTPSWSQTLDGLDHVLTAAATVDVNDATGTGSGWNLTLSGAVLTSSGHTLPQPSTSAAATFSSCDASSTCTLPTSNVGTGAVSYPFTVATTAAKFYSATAATGLGRMTGSNTWSLSILGSSFAGTYTGAWVYSIVSGP